MNFLQKIAASIEKNNSLVCVGLDTDVSKIKESQFDFNKTIIDATYDLVCSYKINSAFYEAQGVEGIENLKQTLDYLKKHHSAIPVILDAKRADIGNTNNGYVQFAFDYLDADAITVHPYLGKEALAPFLDRKDKGIIVLCRTSNPGAREIQDIDVNGRPLYLAIAEKVAKEWNENNNCMLVVGATYPKEMEEIRRVAPEMFFLVPGIGAQGGDLENTLQYGLTKEKSGLLIHSARAIIFAEDPKEEAKKLRDEINKYR